MIYEVIQILSEQVNAYLGENIVVVENIARVDNGDEETESKMKDKVVLTLVGIREENSLKNFPNKTFENNKVQYRNHQVNLNLYLLFCGNRNLYQRSLIDISKVIEFFQGKKLFTQSNTMYDKDNVTMSGIRNFKFSVELYTPAFEEMNFIWGTLGGKQFPSILYKLSLIQIERDQILQEVGQISLVGSNLIDSTQ